MQSGDGGEEMIEGQGLSPLNGLAATEWSKHIHWEEAGANQHSVTSAVNAWYFNIFNIFDNKLLIMYEALRKKEEFLKLYTEVQQLWTGVWPAFT